MIFLTAGIIVLSMSVFGQSTQLPVASNLDSHGVTKDQLESLSNLMSEALDREQIAGCSLLVARRGEEKWL